MYVHKAYVRASVPKARAIVKPYCQNIDISNQYSE